MVVPETCRHVCTYRRACLRHDCHRDWIVNDCERGGNVGARRLLVSATRSSGEQRRAWFRVQKKPNAIGTRFKRLPGAGTRAEHNEFFWGWGREREPTVGRIDFSRARAGSHRRFTGSVRRSRGTPSVVSRPGCARTTRS